MNLTRRTTFWLAAGCLIATICPVLPSANAHGGVFRGPVYPPVPGLPSPSAPPGAGRGTPLPGRNPRRGMTSGPDVRLWETWWALNKEEWFPKRQFKSANAKPNASDDAAYGDGGRPERGPTPDEARENIIPVLKKILKSEKDQDIRDAAAIALGKLGDVREDEVLSELVKDSQRSVREAAIIGLGLLKNPRSERSLLKMASNRNLSGRERAFAMLGLGLSGGELAMEALVDDLGSGKSAGMVVRGRGAQLSSLRALAAALASGSDIKSRKAKLPVEAANNPATGPLVRALRAGLVAERSFLALASAALAKTEDPGALKTVLSALGHRKSEVRGGAALALGRVLQSPEKKMVKKLARMLRAESDPFTKRMMLISFGRIGGEDCINVLRRELSDKDRSQRAFAALALGIAQDRETAPTLRTAFRTAKDASMKGAFGVALALMGDKEAAPLIGAVIEGDKNPVVRAHLVEALSVLGSPDAIPLLETLLVKTRDPSLQGACAQGLGLLGALRSKDLMLKMLSDAGTITLKGAIATGLGRLGDHRLVAPLLAFAQDESQQDAARAFAVAALGIIASKEPEIMPFSRFAIDSHYGIKLEVLDEVRSFL